MSLVAGCAAQTPRPEHTSDAQTAVGDPLVAAPLADAAASEACVTPPDASTLPADMAALRLKAARLFDGGEPVKARALLEELLDSHPGNAAALALHKGAANAIGASRKSAASVFDDAEMVRPSRPAATHTAPSPIARATTGPPPALSGKRETPNQIIDDRKWFERHGVRLPLSTMRALPQNIPHQLRGGRLRKIIDHGDHLALIYGTAFLAIVLHSGAVLRVFNLSPMNHGNMPLTWAQARDGVVYFQAHHMGYARNTGGKNGYIAAIDMKNGELRWRSEPLVGNARNFLLREGYIISGYGFTAEKDALFLLNRSDGRIVKTLPLSTKPSAILEKNGKLLVRGYNRDFEFSLSGPASAPKPGPVEGTSGLFAAPMGPLFTPLEPTANDQCRRNAALIHIGIASPGT